MVNSGNNNNNSNNIANNNNNNSITGQEADKKIDMQLYIFNCMLIWMTLGRMLLELIFLKFKFNIN